MSLIRISLLIIFTTFLITSIMTAVGEGVAPQLASLGKAMKAKDLNNGQAISTLRGIWVRNDMNFYHIDAVNSSTSLTGITKVSFNEQRRLVTASYAQSAKYINNQWRFYHVKTSLMQTESVVNEEQQQTTWPLHFNIHQFSDIEPAQLSLHKLLQQIHYGKISGTNIGGLQITLWTRLFQPLTTLIMVLIAIPFIFGPLRSVSIGLRLLSGIMVGLVFFMVNRFLISFSLVYQIPPFIAAMIIPGAGVLFSFYLFKWKS